MKRSRLAAYLLLPAIVLVVAVADYLIVFHGGAADRIVESEIRNLLGDRVEFEGVTTASDLRSFSINAVRLHAADGSPVVEAAKIDVHLRTPLDSSEKPQIREVVFAGAKILVSDQFHGALRDVVRALGEGPEGGTGPEIVINDASLSFTLPRTFSRQMGAWDLSDLRLIVADEGYRITGAAGHPNLGRWSIRGEYRLVGGGGRLVFENSDLDCPRDIARFFEGPIREAMVRYDPKGRCGCEVSIAFDAAGKTYESALLRPVSLEWTPSGIIERTTAAGGMVSIVGENIDIHDLTCPSGNGAITIRGRQAGSDSLTLEIAARRIAITRDMTEKIARALEGWPEGVVLEGEADVDWQIVKEAGKGERDRIRLSIDRGSLSRGGVALPLRKVRGEAAVSGGVVMIEDLRGFIDDAAWTLAGPSSPEDSSWVLTIDGWTIRPKMIAFLSPSASDAVSSLKPAGTVSGRVKITPSAGDRGTRYAIDAAVKQAKAEIGISLGEIAGTFSGSVEARSGSWLLEGRLDLTGLTAGGKEVQALTCHLQADGKTCDLRDLQAIVCGGTLSAKGAVDLAAGRFRGDCSVRGLDLRSFGKGGGEDGQKIKGTADVDLPQLAFDVAQIRKSLAGSGDVKFHDVFLWEVPIFFHMLNLNLFTFERKPVFQTGSMKLTVGGERFQMADIAFEGENININGKGEIDFGGNLHMILHTRTRTMMTEIPGIRLIENAIDMVKDNIYAVEITGTFDNPVHNAKLLPTILPEK